MRNRYLLLLLTILTISISFGQNKDLPGIISNISPTPNGYIYPNNGDELTFSWSNPASITQQKIYTLGNTLVYDGTPITTLTFQWNTHLGQTIPFRVDCINGSGTTTGDTYYYYVNSLNNTSFPYFMENFNTGLASVTITNNNSNGGWKLANTSQYNFNRFVGNFLIAGTDSSSAPIISTVTFNTPFAYRYNSGFLIDYVGSLNQNDTIYVDTCRAGSSIWHTAEIITSSYSFVGTSRNLLDSSGLKLRLVAKLNSNNSYFAIDNIRIYDGTLPVELTSFDVKSTSSGMKLDWSTATELNNLGFQVERKINEGSFLPIAFIKGEGNSTTPKKYSYLDNSEPKGKITYRLKQLDYDASYSYSKEIELDAFGSITYNLLQNYPNPFNPSTEIMFNIGKNERVRLEVYNLLGEKVKTLIDNELSIGEHKAIWNGTTQSGNIAPSGVYIIKLTTDNFSKTIKASLLK